MGCYVRGKGPEAGGESGADPSARIRTYVRTPVGWEPSKFKQCAMFQPRLLEAGEQLIAVATNDKKWGKPSVPRVQASRGGDASALQAMRNNCERAHVGSSYVGSKSCRFQFMSVPVHVGASSCRFQFMSCMGWRMSWLLLLLLLLFLLLFFLSLLLFLLMSWLLLSLLVLFTQTQAGRKFTQAWEPNAGGTYVRTYIYPASGGT
jgi:hypothetical protein